MADMINHPPHYQDASGIECIEVTRYMKFCGGNCFKYLYRAGQKGDLVEDLLKSAWYAQRAFEQREKVAKYPSDQISRVAQHRENPISDFMRLVGQSDWAKLEYELKTYAKTVKGGES